jgi:transposase
VLNGIFLLLRSSAPWRDLPDNFGLGELRISDHVSGEPRDASDGLLVHLVFAQFRERPVVTRFNHLQKFFNGALFGQERVRAAFFYAAHILRFRREALQV